VTPGKDEEDFFYGKDEELIRKIRETG